MQNLTLLKRLKIVCFAANSFGVKGSKPVLGSCLDYVRVVCMCTFISSPLEVKYKSQLQSTFLKFSLAKFVSQNEALPALKKY